MFQIFENLLFRRFARAILATFVIAYTGSVQATTFGDALDANREQVREMFRSNAEPTARGAAWGEADLFLIGVADQASIPDGYEDYVCKVLYDYGFHGKKVKVQIVDIKELGKSGSWVYFRSKQC
jgi:hypothetical protein